ncbi:MAG TPA: serine/threonine-protein kinase [Myxococcales bacterium]|nr:serine/threonine-protein kinase [Myxococcales bacterium]
MDPDREDTQSLPDLPGHATPAPAHHPPPVEAEAVPRGTAIGRYLVVHRLGQGGMGVVYSAYDAELDRKVALKLLRPRALGGSNGHARLLREAQAMAKVSHPNVIAVHDVGSFGDQVFMAMDLVEGSTLSRWVKQEGRTWQQVAGAFLDAGRGLAAAHAAGLVHRDFKPQNVLVGRDGRVFVTDFGLARMADASDAETDPQEEEERELERRSRLARNLTQEGVVLGTPRYMAPEQHLGGQVDARADQFSFCASLYWGLWRTHPFDPAALAQSAEKRLRQTGPATTPLRPNSRDLPASPISEPPSQPRVPARLRKAVMLGLSLDPERRFPGMDALLQEIAAALHPPSMQVALAAAALAGVLLLGGGAWAYRDRARSQLCSGGVAEIGAVWNPAVAGMVQAALTAVSPERGPELSRPLVAALDGYSSRWAQAHRDACEATRVRGEQTETILSLRMVCLERRRKELAALVRLLEHPDAALVDRAVEAAQGLSAVGQCGDVDALAQVGRPEDPARRASLEKLEEQLARVNALRMAGRYPQGLEEAKVAAGVAQALGFKPLEAQARFELGTLEDATGDQRSAASELHQALRLAEAGRDDVTKARVVNRLGFVIGYRDLQFDQGVAWIRLSEATLERLGAERYPEVESETYTMLGLIQLRAGDFRTSINAFQRSLTSADRAPNTSDLIRARALANIAVSRCRLGEREEGVRSGKQAIVMFERLRGPDHPILVEPLQNLANALAELGRLDEALAAADRALALAESKLGKDHGTTGDVLDTRAGVLLEMGRPKEALVDSERALAIHRASKEAEMAEGFSLDIIGRSDLALGRLPEAVAALERASALKPTDDLVMGDIHFGLARALAASRGDKARALALAEEARQSYQAVHHQRRLAELESWMAGQGVRARAR